MRYRAAPALFACVLASFGVGCRSKPEHIVQVPTTQLAGRPSFAALWEAYPRGTPGDVVGMIGGKVAYNYDTDPLYRNTCAIRISRALNYGSAPIQRGVAGALSNSGSDKRWYIFRMAELGNYLTARYGAPAELPTDASAKSLAHRHGIVSFGKLHIDLWNGDTCGTANYFGSDKFTGPILFWEMAE
ncbi:MAG: T6SS effector amidase Tae4 family protein [Tepidisphaeraceae bacterium]